MQQIQSWSSILVVLAALLLNQVTISQCYSHFALKSSKTNGLPIDPAMEKIQPRTIDCGDALQRPSKKDLNERKLRRRLAGSIDERFLSIMEPLHSSDTFVRQVSLRGISTSEKNLLRQIIRNETSSKMGKPSPFIERYMMKWLIQKSDCPVEYTWKDLGFCYWPRWISVRTFFFYIYFDISTSDSYETRTPYVNKYVDEGVWLIIISVTDRFSSISEQSVRISAHFSAIVSSKKP